MDTLKLVHVTSIQYIISLIVTILECLIFKFSNLFETYFLQIIIEKNSFIITMPQLKN
jgi:hypothetical protein